MENEMINGRLCNTFIILYIQKQRSHPSSKIFALTYTNLTPLAVLEKLRTRAISEGIVSHG
jgi:hypothetical protein